MYQPLYKRHDLNLGFITEHGISTLGYGWRNREVEVGLDHISEDSLWKQAGAKGSGYSVDDFTTTT